MLGLGLGLGLFLAGGAQVLTGWNNRVLTGILGFPKGPPTPFTS